MKHLLPAIAFVLISAGCTQLPIQPPPGAHPIDTINPPEETPLAKAWYRDKQLTMGLDTGAVQESLLFSPTVTELGGKIRGRGLMQSTNIGISLLPGGEPLSKQQDAIVISDAPYDGLLGWKTIRQYVWNLNYPKGVQNFYTSLPSRVKKWNHLHLVKASDFAQVKDSSGRRIMIDTGAPYALYIAKKNWERFKQDYPDATVSVYSGFSPAAGGAYALECMRIKSYKVGNLELRDIIACESFVDKNIINIDHDIDILLGISAFYGREFWLDGPGNTLYFSSRMPVKNPAPPFNSVGATFVPQTNGRPPFIAKVAPWSVAWNNGLRTGDVLISLNGIKHPNQKFIEYFTSNTGANAEMVVHRKRQIVTVTWTVPPTPEAGEYHPTPEAVTEEDFERHLQEELKQQQEAGQGPPPSEQPTP